MNPADPLRRVGTVLRDKWTLESLLGVGGMAAVYVGVHKIGRRDALKILHPEAARNKDVCKRFEREAQAVNRFRHPGAVEIRDIDVAEDGAPFLVMELLEGESLGERAQRLGKLEVAEVLGHVEQALDVLAAAHREGIIHRDIKPANLFVQEDGRLKVLDFGLARVIEGTGADGILTKEGTTIGTTPYMPPEQATGKAIDERADVFAIGATFFKLVTGRYIHDASSAFDLLMKMGREPAPPIRAIAPTVPADVGLVVDRALVFKRDHRYPSAQMMLEDVRAVRAGERPRHALQLAGGIEAAMTRDTAPDLPPSVGPTTSQEIPIYLSGFSTLVPGQTPRVEAPPPAPPAVETTLVSPQRAGPDEPTKPR